MERHEPEDSGYVLEVAAPDRHPAKDRVGGEEGLDAEKVPEAEAPEDRCPQRRRPGADVEDRIVERSKTAFRDQRFDLGELPGQTSSPSTREPGHRSAAPERMLGDEGADEPALEARSLRRGRPHRVRV